MELVYGLEEIAGVAETLWNHYKDTKIWLLQGEMGAGKTTFSTVLCRDILQTKDSVSSPSFSIINLYKSPVIGQICHIDLYRVKEEEEAVDAGVEDAIFSSGFSLVEWASLFPSLFYGEVLNLEFDIVASGKRRVRATKVKY